MIRKRTTSRSVTKRPGAVLWFTGLSGSGKTTLARRLIRQLRHRHVRVQHIDGDVFRRTLTSHLGFSKVDRIRNLELAALFAKEISADGIIVIATFISPFRKQRDQFRNTIPRFYEIFLSASLDQCSKRDQKGLYQLARRGILKNFTGVNHPYEPPQHPDLVIPTGDQPLTQSLFTLINFLEEKKII